MPITFNKQRPQDLGASTGPGQTLAALREEGIAPDPQTGEFSEQEDDPIPEGFLSAPKFENPQNAAQAISNIPWAAETFATKSLPGSALQMGQGIAEMVANPMQTARSLHSIASGAAQKVLPVKNRFTAGAVHGLGAINEEQNKIAADMALDFYRSRYGSMSNAANTAYSDPLGFLSDLSLAIGGPTALLDKGAQMVNMSKLASQASKIARAADAIDPGGALMRALNPLQLAPQFSAVNGAQELPMSVADELPKGSMSMAAGKGSSQLPPEQSRLTTPVLQKLSKQGAKQITKQGILELAKGQDIRAGERAMIEKIAGEFPEDAKIPVEEFQNRVQSELLPLGSKDLVGADARYIGINIDAEHRGEVGKYAERIYESPIKTDAGDVHFRNKSDKYFAHVRYEDLGLNPDTDKRTLQIMAEEQGTTPEQLIKDAEELSTTRRILEVQSDLMQKDRLESEFATGGSFDNGADANETIALANKDPDALKRLEEDANAHFEYLKKDHSYKESKRAEVVKGFMDARKRSAAQQAKKLQARLPDKEKLQPYRNTWHERILREEIQKAAADGKTKLQLPTGKTAMKIEGLADMEQTGSPFALDADSFEPVNAQNINAGTNIVNMNNDSSWVVIAKVEDANIFSAVSRDSLQNFLEDVSKKSERARGLDVDEFLEAARSKSDAETQDWWHNITQMTEKFNIDYDPSKNPIYQFYEKDIQKFLKKINPNMQRITDPQGIEWFEIPISPEDATNPIVAFDEDEDTQTA